MSEDDKHKYQVIICLIILTIGLAMCATGNAPMY